MRKLFVSVAVAFVVAACGTLGPSDADIDGPIRARLGMPISAVIDDIGFPSAERTVAGRKAYVWTKRFQGYGGAFLDCELAYEVDADERVVDYRWEGSAGACSF